MGDLVKPPPPGKGFFFALSANITAEDIRIYPPPLSPLFLPAVKSHPLTMYPFRSSHAAA